MIHLMQTERLCTFDQDNLDERGKPTPEYIKLYEEWGKVGFVLSTGAVDISERRGTGGGPEPTPRRGGISPDPRG